MLAFASMRSTPFMEIDDKGERLYTDMKALGKIETKKYGATLRRNEECERIKKFLTRKAHKLFASS